MPYGIFTPNDACILCGRTKPAGRTALTCQPCATLRNDILKGGLDRTPLLRTDCFSCGAPFKSANTNSLCTKCGIGFREWKATGSVRPSVSEPSDTGPTYADYCIWMVKHRLTRPETIKTRARIIDWCESRGFPETPVSETSDTSN